MESFLLKGVMIGVLFGIPVGAVGALTVQRILEYGPKAGIVSGLGSSSADCLYACVGAFGLTSISDTLVRNQCLIHIAGGAFILLLGLRMIVKRAESVNTKEERTDIIKMFFSSFAAGITNPAAILTFLFAFSYFEIPGNLNLTDGTQIVLGVFAGTFLWWISLAVIVGMLRSEEKKNKMGEMNRIFGGFLILFGMTVLIKGIY